MNKQSNVQPTAISKTTLANFQQMGAMRKRPSIFGQLIGASPVEKTLNTFRSAGLMLPEPNLFGLPVSGFIRSTQPNECTVKQGPIIRLPKPRHAELTLTA